MKKIFKSDLLYTGITSFLFSMVMLLQTQIKFTETAGKQFIQAFHFDIVFFMQAILLAIPCFFAIHGLLCLLKKITFKNDQTLYSKKIFCSITFISIFLSSILFLLTFYPGSNMNDTLNIIYNPIGVSYQHPLVYNLGLSCTYRLFFKLFHSMNLAFFCTGVVQILIMDTIVTSLLWWFHKTFKNKIGTILLTLYFVLLPIVSNYHSVLVKDAVFAGVLLLYLPLLYEIVVSKGKWLEQPTSIIKAILLFTATALIRNNGLYVILLILLLLIILFKQYFKKLLLILAVVLVLYEIPTTYSKVRVMEPLFQEKSGVLIQQIGYLLHTDKDISMKDRTYLNQIMDGETWKAAYNPFNVDYVKWNPSFNSIYLTETKQVFIKTWLHLLPRHFESYVKSYILMTYGLWSVDHYIPTQGTFLGLDLSDQNSANPFPDLQRKQIFPTKIQKSLTTFYLHNTKFLSNGSCFWILILLFLLCVYQKKKELLLLTVPLLGVWLTLMVSAPISFALRYMVAYVFLLPFLFFIITSYQKKDYQ